MIRKSVILALSLLLAFLPAACTSQPQEFKSEAGRFKVTAPAALQETTQAVEAQSGKLDLRLFYTQQDDIGYFVSYCDYPPEVVQKADPEKMLDGARDGAVSNAKGKLLQETKITLAGHPGREMLIEAISEMGSASIIKERLFMVKNRLYQVVVVAPRSKVGDKEVDAFLQSFKLLAEAG